jgi:predicted helicase|tara:strand:+ start:222 stop:440 length:219 start_codon:yes stop_codon:yes gene_type:complete
MTITSDSLYELDDDIDLQKQAQEQQQAQEEANQHFVIEEFGRLVLSCGPAAVLGQMDEEAKDELKFILQGSK